MKIGIIGLPYSGKRTIFRALTGQHISDDMLLKGGKPPTAMVKLPDERLDALHEHFPGHKKVQATLEFFLTSGIEEGDGKRSGALEHVTHADVLCHVIRAFEDADVYHIYKSINPARDFEAVDMELLLSDIAIVEKRMEKLESDRKKIKSDELQAEYELLSRIHKHMQDGQPIRSIKLTEQDEILIRGFRFLSQKPQLIALNIGEEQVGDEAFFDEIRRRLSVPESALAPLCAKLEGELVELEADEQMELLEAYGLKQPAMISLTQGLYEHLGMITFYTIGSEEVRAWRLPSGSSAVKAAGTIHSDMERGFIKAEVVPVQTFLEFGSMSALKEAGKLAIKGKDYIVQDGDIIQVRFNV